MDSLHMVSVISLSKFPEGKVLTRQMYLPSSETSVPTMTREDSTVGWLLLKCTRLDHDPNAADRERQKREREFKACMRKDVTQKVKSSKFKIDPRLSFATFSSIHMPACLSEIALQCGH